MKRQLTLTKKMLFVLYLILLLIISSGSRAQTIKRQCISSYGATVSTEKILILQTAGQSYNTTPTYNTSSVLQGFQQPVVFKLSVEDAAFSTKMNMKVYPNPAAYSITLENAVLFENSILIVSDLNGKIILTESLNDSLMYSIDCKLWENGTYIITIVDKDRNISSLKLTITK